MILIKLTNWLKIWYVIIVLLVSLFIYHLCNNAHRSSWNMSKNYMWIFKDSVKKDIDTTISFSWIKEQDICSHFIYKRGFIITLWDFKDLYPLDLKDVSINTNVFINDIDVTGGKGEILNSKTSPQTVVKFGETFHTKININLDDKSTILTTLESDNYKGFNGVVNKMSFTNELNDDYIEFIYPKGKEPTLLLAYKNKSGFYLIIIELRNTNLKLDESILNIFNI